MFGRKWQAALQCGAECMYKMMVVGESPFVAPTGSPFFKCPVGIP